MSSVLQKKHFHRGKEIAIERERKKSLKRRIKDTRDKKESGREMEQNWEEKERSRGSRSQKVEGKSVGFWLPFLSFHSLDLKDRRNNGRSTHWQLWWDW